MSNSHKVLHYEIPYETGVSGSWKTFCGKIVITKYLAQLKENITCEKCKEELKKYNESGQNI